MDKVSAVSERMKARQRADLLTIRVLNNFKQFELKNPVIDSDAQDEYYNIVTRIAYVILKTAVSENKPVFSVNIFETALNDKLKAGDSFVEIDCFLMAEALDLLEKEELIFEIARSRRRSVYCITEKSAIGCFLQDFSVVNRRIHALAKALKFCDFLTADYMEEVEKARGYPGRRLIG